MAFYQPIGMYIRFIILSTLFLFSYTVHADDLNSAYYGEDEVTISYNGDDEDVFRLTFMHIVEGNTTPYRWRVRNTSGQAITFQYGFYKGSKSESVTLQDGEEFYFSTKNGGTMKLYDENGNEFSQAEGFDYFTTKQSGDVTKTPPGIPVDGGLGFLLVAGGMYGFRKLR